MDHKDFALNPKKYELFKTAVIESSIFTENGESDLAVGTIVGVKFDGVRRNQLRRRDEPVYEITLQSGKFWGYLFANALTDFVL